GRPLSSAMRLAPPRQERLSVRRDMTASFMVDARSATLAQEERVWCPRRYGLVKTHVAPALTLSEDPPIIAVLPSAERDTEMPPFAIPAAPVPTSSAPCWVQTPPLRVQTHADQTFPLSPNPPTMAVLPSAERDTTMPCSADPTASVPINLDPC